MPVPFKVNGIPNNGGLPAKALVSEVIYVDSATGSTDGSGTDPRDPVSSIALAFSRNLVTTNGVCAVFPGHSESVIAAAGISCDIAGVHVIGLGEGTARPTINLTTATGADIDIDAANITFENLLIDETGIDAVAAGIDVNAANFTMRNCEVILADAGGQATVGLLTDANASRMLIEDCLFYGTADAGTATAIRIVGGDRITIRGNTIRGAFTTTLGGVQNLTTLTTNLMVEYNHIANITAASTTGVDIIASTTGHARFNTFEVNSGIAPIDATGLLFLNENYCVDTADQTGALVGTASS